MLECNWTAVRVFQACEQHLAAGMGGVCWLGIAAVEILAGCRLLRVPRAQWPDVSEAVRYMGSVVAGELNKRKG